MDSYNKIKFHKMYMGPHDKISLKYENKDLLKKLNHYLNYSQSYGQVRILKVNDGG